MALSGWKPLPEFEGDFPPLLAMPVFGTSSYTLYITDLVNLWEEQSGESQILERSEEQQTSIDASEGPDQMALLLRKLNAAFDPTAADHDQTSLEFSAHPLPHKDSGIALHASCTLPAGLAPLRWTFDLKRHMSSVALVSKLTVPLIQAQQVRDNETRSLVGLLKEKDAVISRLMDKLEAINVGPEQVFNALSGKKKASLELAREKVKGLAPFKEGEWASNTVGDANPVSDRQALFQAVFGRSRPTHAPSQELQGSQKLKEQWWYAIGRGTVKAIHHKSSALSVPPQSQSSAQPRQTQTQDDEFQVQEMPHHMARRSDHAGNDADQQSQSTTTLSAGQESTKASIPQDDDAETESDNEPARPVDAKKPPRGLGRIGRKAKAASPSPAPSPPPPAAQPSADDDDVTDSDPGDDISASEAAPAPPPETPSVGKARKGGLGFIGGKRKTAAPETTTHSEQSSHTAQDTATTTASPKPAHKRLGLIGGASRKDKASDTASGPSRHQGDAREGNKAEQEEQEETDEQKAERKRAELARELERRSAAGPAKKKRKF